MPYPTLGQFLARPETARLKGPIAIIMAEDDVALDATLRHHLKLGFARVILLADAEAVVTPRLGERISRVTYDVYAEDALSKAVTQIAALCPGQWIYYGYNAEFLFFPFCETRSVRELLTFHVEERRAAMLAYVVDLYASDLEQSPNAVALDNAYLDRSGYYALARKDAEDNWREKERQMDFFGGLRWRFEEHVPWERRRIDRIALFTAQAGLTLRPDFTLSVEEMNTYACPWHHNLTAAVCSFRTAKALRTNPGSRHAISSFMWRNSENFHWDSRQLMDLGLMEPGQWF